jgi:tripartite-type tricarboxylate transporter receptor subunit TctC
MRDITDSRAPADGYTLLLASAETHAIAPFAINPFSLVSRLDFPANNIRELLALVKSQPGKFSYSSAGVSSTILQRLATDVSAVAQAVETRAAFRKLGVDAYPSMTPQEFQRFLESEKSRWGVVIRSAGLKPE